MMTREKQKLIWRVSAATLISAILYFYSTGLNLAAALLFIAPVPVLIVAYRSTARTSFIISFAAYALGGLNIAGYMSRLAPLPIVIITIVLPGVMFSLTVLISRFAALRLKPWIAVVVFPSAWTTYEYLLSLVSPHGTAGSIAYSQTDFLPLIQFASLTGIWGITFVVTLVQSTVALAWHLKDSRRQMVRILALPIAMIIVVMAFGWMRLSQPEATEGIAVGLAAADSSVLYFNSHEPNESLPVAQAFALRAARLAEKGAKIVVLPEKFVGVTPAYISEVATVFSGTAQAHHVTIVAGLNVIGTPASHNEAFIFSPDGTELRYDKRYFVPGIETGYYRGEVPLMFHLDRSIAGVEICKDMDFPTWSRQYGEHNVNVLFVPAWDFTIDGRLHSRMAIMRGVENGFSIVRCAQQGLLTISDYRGRIIAEKSSSGAPEVMLLDVVHPGPGKTFYAAFGDWFAWLNILILLLTFSRAFVYNPIRNEEAQSKRLP